MSDSAAALEAYIATQLASLNLDVPSDDVEFMARFVEEDLEHDDKLEGARGLLEGVVPDGLPEGSDAALERILGEHARLAAQAAEKEAERVAREEEEKAKEKEKEKEKEIDVEAVLASATDEELAAARKAALLRQYAYVEGGPEIVEREGAPPRGLAAAEAEERRRAEERRALISEALRLDGMKKKNRKKHQQFDDPLMWENLNKEKVAAASAMARDAAKQQATDKRNRDRAALEKQRADAAKSKADKQKKAQKQERRA